jgi:carboxypeptidase C (cathepsin A)
MAGESYGGRYIPLFASAVHDLNPRLVKAGFDAINLTSVMIGSSILLLGFLPSSVLIL